MDRLQVLVGHLSLAEHTSRDLQLEKKQNCNTYVVALQSEALQVSCRAFRRAQRGD